MLQISHLYKNYGKFQAVRDLNLHVPKGDLFGFVGPNGAGKTTTIRMVCGLMPPTEGTITIHGVDALLHPKEIKKQIGYVPDFFGVYDKGWYSITDIVGEERNVIYKSRNAQEAYMKWNVYIGRKKERTASGRNSDAEHGNRAEGNRAYDARDRRNRDSREKRDMTDRRGNNNRGRHER